MIRIEHLTKTYSSRQGTVTALDDVSLGIPSGAVYGIIGLSGAGKSTLVRCLNLLERPTAGSILIDDQELTQLSERDLRKARQKIGMVFQHFNLLSSRTVAENIAFPLEIAGRSRSEIEQRVAELLPLVGLEDKARAYPGQLSGGQKQRVGIARALAANPAVLLCDEATSALDPQTTLAILSLLREINEKLGLTIVMITHEMKVIKEICTHVAVIHQAHIVEHGPVETVFIHPQSAIAKEFVASVFPDALPDDLLARLSCHLSSVIIRVRFLTTNVSEPVISDLLRTCEVRANILYGNIDHLRSTLLGSLTLELQGSAEQLAQAFTYFEARDLNVEVIPHAV